MAEIPSAEQSVNAMVSTLHNIAAAHMPVGISVGRVLAPPPDIKIAWNNIILEKEQIYIDQFLLPQYNRSLKGETLLPKAEGLLKTATRSRRGGTGDAEYEIHMHKLLNTYTAIISGDYQASAIYTDCGLKAGDYVSVLPIDGGQKFIILGKLVYLPEFEQNEGEGEGGGDTDSDS